MNPEDPRPRGELGRAFADLSDGGPPSALTAADIIAMSHRESHRRHRWVLGAGVAAAAVAVTTLIGVSVSREGGGAESSSSAAGAGTSSATSSRAQSLIPAESEADSAGDAGGGAAPPAPEASASAAPSRSGRPGGPVLVPAEQCPDPLSATQQGLVEQYLPDLGGPTGGCPAGSEGASAAAAYDGPGVIVTVSVESGEGGCPTGVSCTPVEGYDGVSVGGAPGDQPVNEGISTVVVAAADGMVATVSVVRDGATGPLLYPVETLAALAAALAG